MRPIYETEHDRENEQTVFKWVGDEYGCTLLKVKGYHCCDSKIVRDGVQIGWAEVKRRHIDHNTYKWFKISDSKWKNLLQLAEADLLPVFLFILFDDGLFQVPVIRQMYTKVVMGGRTKNPRDDQDIEPMRIFHVDNFIKVASAPF